MGNLNNNELNNIVQTLKQCRNEITECKDKMYQDSYKEVRKCLSSAISALNRADKEITNTLSIEGQTNIFDYLEDYEDEYER